MPPEGEWIPLGRGSISLAGFHSSALKREKQKISARAPAFS